MKPSQFRRNIMQKILDIHTHAYPEKVASKAVDFLNNYYHIDCQGNGTIGDLKKSAAEAGVSHILVHAVATRPDQVENVNTWIGAHIGGNILGFGTIHPQYDHIEEELKRIRSLGLRGLKLHPDFQGFFVDDSSMDRIYSAIEGVMPVLIHAGDKTTDFSSPYRIANVLKKFPKLTIIAAHLGGYSEWMESEKCLIGKNIYIDTSSSIPFIGKDKALQMIKSHGVDKVLFGTDYPLTRHKEELERFLSLDLTPEEQRKIFFDNASKLLHIKD